MVSANQEMAVYCFDTLVAHYNSEEAPPPAFDAGQQSLSLSVSCLSLHVFVLWGWCLKVETLIGTC